MPAVHAPATILVTGASGFSGSWIARAFLEAGYSVRGAVRSESKGQYLVELFKTHGDRFKPVVVEDISKVRSHHRIPLYPILRLRDTAGSVR